MYAIECVCPIYVIFSKYCHQIFIAQIIKCIHRIWLTDLKSVYRWSSLNTALLIARFFNASFCRSCQVNSEIVLCICVFIRTKTVRTLYIWHCTLTQMVHKILKSKQQPQLAAIYSSTFLTFNTHTHQNILSQSSIVVYKSVFVCLLFCVAVVVVVAIILLVALCGCMVRACVYVSWKFQLNGMISFCSFYLAFN